MLVTHVPVADIHKSETLLPLRLFNHLLGLGGLGGALKSSDHLGQVVLAFPSDSLQLDVQAVALSLELWGWSCGVGVVRDLTQLICFGIVASYSGLACFARIGELPWPTFFASLGLPQGQPKSWSHTGQA